MSLLYCNTLDNKTSSVFFGGLSVDCSRECICGPPCMWKSCYLNFLFIIVHFLFIQCFINRFVLEIYMYWFWLEILTMFHSKDFIFHESVMCKVQEKTSRPTTENSSTFHLKCLMQDRQQNCTTIDPPCEGQSLQWWLLLENKGLQLMGFSVTPDRIGDYFLSKPDFGIEVRETAQEDGISDCWALLFWVLYAALRLAWWSHCCRAWYGCESIL